MKLSATKIKNINKPGKYYDGKGLFLLVSKTLRKTWIMRYQLNKKRTDLGLGSADYVTLKEARDTCLEYHKLMSQGTDPKLYREKQRGEHMTNRKWTFDTCATEYIKLHSSTWKNQKHAAQWNSSLQTYASPVIGSLPVEAITISHILDVLKPIWKTKTETASRVRGRIERILSWAIVQGYRPHPNPALWKGNLSEILPKQSKVQRVKHHPALHYNDMPEFWQKLSKHTSINANCLRWTILTACRTNESIAAQWDEIDNGIWTIPSTRSKSGREHRVPLSDELIQLLDSLPRENNWLFPSSVMGKHLSNIAMLNLLKKTMGYADLTVHGFRSTFRDWAAEQTNHPRELAEAALAHVLNDKTEAAYQRGDLLEKRRVLMLDWYQFCNNYNLKICCLVQN